MWSTVVGRVWSRSGVGYGVGKGLKYGGGRIGGGGGVVPVRSLSVEPLREGVKSLMNKAMIYTGLKEPALKVRPPQFFNLGCKMPRSSFWRTKYNLRHRMYTKALLSKAKIRRGRIGRYRGLRRRLRREVKKLVAQRLVAKKKYEVKKAELQSASMTTVERANALVLPNVMQEFSARSAPVLRELTTQKKWVPIGFYAMPKVPGTRQPLAPPSYDPTAPPIVKRKPRTNGVRHVALIDRSALYKGRPFKALVEPQVNKAGRDRTGRITVRGRGGGYKHMYRLVDFKRAQHLDMEGVIERIEYDPNRSAFICLLKHHVPEGRELPLANVKRPHSYILCPRGIRIGDKVMSSRTQSLDPSPGNSMLLRNIPLGTTIHNIEMYPGRGGTVVRSAGTGAILLEKNDTIGKAIVRLPSKEVKMFSLLAMATVGSVSNPNHKNQVLGKAGRSRNRGFRPKVRGVAMNPVDHPHGGGNGKTGTGRIPVSRYGRLAKGGKKTRKKNKFSDTLIVTTRHEARKRSGRG